MRRFISMFSVFAITATLLISGSSLASAETIPSARLMTKADLKPFGGLYKPAKYYWDLGAQDSDLVNSVCIDSKGQPILFPNANGWVAGGRLSGKKYADVTEFVRDYGTPEALAAAWTALTTALAKCPSTSTEEIESGNPREYYKVKQTPKLVTDSVALLKQQVAVSPDRRINGGSTATYSVYSQSGNAIVEVSYYSNPGKTVTAGTMAKVNELTAQLSTRWSQ